ncbi:sulfotransferase domain-containing protein [Aliiglaciecola sp. 2_MG-2023]|uniref:sulfotransferase domain-containing protein n=1 Tax=unclassified Aliiglaciecola TaxID=2593648 RepID=UPI0026E3B090|nr:MULTISPECIES: sulfotransferase domain-containing protein [unclassified Aliiglaciecola]MDO6712211.1 sulfotransferase domain-containing protein [Aliiglaciecola sp. 2_MG-2023]MDO6753551.1 sulfotransferase domain-containing protein [Aliiglaciecola sp. 1_MG-2023]
MILTNGRSGSNYLVDIINQHPSLYNYGEVLGSWSKKRKIKQFLRIEKEEDYLQFILQNKVFFYLSQLFYFLKNRSLFKYKKPSYVTHTGIKEFGIHIQRLNLKHWLLNNDNLQIIHLYRENQLDRYISLFAMQSTGLVSSQKSSSKMKITIDCNDLLNTLDIYEKEMEFQFELANSVDSSRVMSLSYENLFYDENKNELIGQMFDFLGVPRIPLKERHKRILSNELSEKIENYSELVNALQGTKYSKYLG